jgi:hypothetical protein
VLNLEVSFHLGLMLNWGCVFLQILDGIVNPVNRSVDEHTHQFRRCFLNYGVP